MTLGIEAGEEARRAAMLGLWFVIATGGPQ
jgi:hypothetical protein